MEPGSPLVIFSGLFGRGEVAAAVGDRAWARAMLDFEAALIRDHLSRRGA